MAYITKEEVSAIRKALKEEYGSTIKFSVTMSNHSSVNIKILSSTEVDFNSNPDYDNWGHNGETWVNPYMDNRAKQVLSRIDEIAKLAPAATGEGREWYDNSDIMTDYFDVAYYIFTEIGKWNNPYEYTGEDAGKHKVAKEGNLYIFSDSKNAAHFDSHADQILREAA